MTAKVEIRLGSDADLYAFVAVLGQRNFFTDRLARQQGGGGVLVAWLDGRPVGDVFLECEPAVEPKVRRWLPGVPRLDHLEVLGPVQRRGIGTALICAGEDATRRLGHEQLVLGVGVDNPDARRLYERLGYADWGHQSVVRRPSDAALGVAYLNSIPAPGIEVRPPRHPPVSGQSPR